MASSIIVENLSKQYRIGELHRETRFGEVLANRLKHPFRRKEKETIWALDNVSFTVEEGEVCGIIGRNGAGKSTLLKVLSKITHPTSGAMKVDGRIASLLEVGTGFHEELTGRENISLNGSILGMTKREIDGAFSKIVTFAGVEKFIDTPVKRYSSGMRLRLGFAVAAHLIADVLLVDEVLAVGDAEFQKKCLKAMDTLGSGGRTVLFVSHNMAAVENLCPRVIWIDNGQIRQDGDAREVIKSYLSTFVGAQKAGLDLSNIETRGGSGVIRYTGIEFLNSGRQPRDFLSIGDSLIVRLHYHGKERIQNPHFGLEIYTELGTLVTSINTWSTGFEIPHLPQGDGHIELEVDSLNLIPGRYYVSLWLASVGLSYDRLDHCTILDIESSDFNQTGRKITSQFGIIYVPCKWSLNGA